MIFNNARLEELTRLIEPTIILPGKPIIYALRFASVPAHLNRLLVRRAIGSRIRYGSTL